MESAKIQLELKPDAITVRVNLWQGVLTTKTFEGPDCYRQMLNFIKQACPDEQSIPAIVVIQWIELQITKLSTFENNGTLYKIGLAAGVSRLFMINHYKNK